MLLTQSQNFNALDAIEAAANVLLTAYRSELVLARLSLTREQAKRVTEQLEAVLQDAANTRAAAYAVKVPIWPSNRTEANANVQ